jgi:hypothetical protein
MSKAEVERHKMWEHPVPVSPFEERPANASRGTSPEDLHRLTSDVTVGGNSNVMPIGRQRRKAASRPL